MAIRAALLRSLLDEIWRCSQAHRVPLGEALDLRNAQIVEGASGGRTIKATAGNGESVTFGTTFGLREIDFLDATDRLKQLYSRCVSDLTDAVTGDEPTDCEIVQCISKKCVGRKRIMADFLPMNR
jgi:hypothetical protein